MRKRVLVVLEAMGIGGVETHVLNCLKLLHQDYDFYVVAKDGIYKDEFKKYSKGILDLDFYDQTPNNNINNAKQLTDFIKKNKIDVIHIHQYLPYYAVVAAHYATGVPYVFTIHSFLFPEDGWRQAWGEDFVGFWEDIVFKYASSVAFVSDQLKKYWNDKFAVFSKKSHIIPNLIDFGDYKYNPTDGSKFFMSIRISDDKKSQIDTAIKIVDHYSKSYKKTTLTIAGDGNLLSCYKQEYKDSKNIRFIGPKTNIGELIDDYDIIIGSGRTAIEGLACGKKVIIAGLYGLKGVISPDNFTLFKDRNFAGCGLKDYSQKAVCLQLDELNEAGIKSNYRKLKVFLDDKKLKLVFSKLYKSTTAHKPNNLAYLQLLNQISAVHSQKIKVQEVEQEKESPVSEIELAKLYRKYNILKKLAILFFVAGFIIMIIYLYIWLNKGAW